MISDKLGAIQMREDLPCSGACLNWELSLCLWLIVKGVDLPKWEERALESVRCSP